MNGKSYTVEVAESGQLAAVAATPVASPSRPSSRLSALVTATLRCLLEYYDVDIPRVLLPNLVLSVETEELGIAAGLAGSLIGLSKFYDMISDPIMGQISDRTKTKWGRRRPYLLVGTFACPLALLALFHLPTFESSTITIALLFFVLMILLLFATQPL